MHAVYRYNKLVYNLPRVRAEGSEKAIQLCEAGKTDNSFLHELSLHLDAMCEMIKGQGETIDDLAAGGRQGISFAFTVEHQGCLLIGQLRANFSCGALFCKFCVSNGARAF